jgi:hypothetical protein
METERVAAMICLVLGHLTMRVSYDLPSLNDNRRIFASYMLSLRYSQAMRRKGVRQISC